MNAPASSVKSLSAQLKSHAAILLGCLVVLYAIELLDSFLPGNHPLDRWGIQPRSFSGLLGIAFAPLLHGDFNHLRDNTGPFFVMSWLIMLSGIRLWFGVTAAVASFGGLGVWLFGSGDSVHIGLSGVIFGYLGFLLARGYYERRIGSIIVALIVGWTYIFMLFSLASLKEHVSWSGHFFGFLGGIGVAWARFDPEEKLPT